MSYHPDPAGLVKVPKAAAPESKGRGPCLGVGRDKLQMSLRLACTWVTDVARVQSDKLTFERKSHVHGHRTRRGAILERVRALARVALSPPRFLDDFLHAGGGDAACVTTGVQVT